MSQFGLTGDLPWRYYAQESPKAEPRYDPRDHAIKWTPADLARPPALKPEVWEEVEERCRNLTREYLNARAERWALGKW
jgi:hypothetical protein